MKWKLFRLTGPLWAKITGYRWIPLTKTSDAELWCFIWSAWINYWVNNLEAGDFRFRQLLRHRNVELPLDKIYKECPNNDFCRLDSINSSLPWLSKKRGFCYPWKRSWNESLKILIWDNGYDTSNKTIFVINIWNKASRAMYREYIF